MTDGTSTWGDVEALGPLDTIMWRGEADPGLRSTVMGMELLDTVPDWDRLVAAHDWATRLIPRFRQRIVESPVPLATPRWSRDETFDLHYHLRRQHLAAPGDWPTLLAAAEQLAMTPFDRSRPPWEAVLFEGLPDGRAAYVLKMHHASSDGLGFVQLLSQVHSRTRKPNRGKAQPAAPDNPAVSQRDLIVRQVTDDLRGLPHLASSLTVTATKALRSPVRSTRDALRYVESVRRTTGGAVAAGSPLLAKRSVSWRFAAIDVDFPSLYQASKAGGGSFNDGYLASLLGGFRLYHEELGHPVEEIPMAIPISIRKEGDAAGSNRIASGRLAGPVGIVDPAPRIIRVHELIDVARAEPALEATAVMGPALARLPGSVVARLAGGLTRSNDLQASNIPGLREDVYLAGAKIERVYPFGPLPGCAVMAAVVTHGQTCCVAVNYDAAAIIEPDRFVGCLAAGFAEVLSLHPGSPAPVVRR